jgi:hypothetical protein
MMPKFTAEASLYVAGRHYQMVAIADQTSGRPQPAFFGSMLNSCFAQCAARCLRSWAGVDSYCMARCHEMCGAPTPSVRSYDLDF